MTGSDICLFLMQSYFQFQADCDRYVNAMYQMDLTVISALSLSQFQADSHSNVSDGSDTDLCSLYSRLTVTAMCQIDLTLISALSLFQADCHSYVPDGSDTDLCSLYSRLTVTAMCRMDLTLISALSIPG